MADHRSVLRCRGQTQPQLGAGVIQNGHVSTGGEWVWYSNIQGLRRLAAVVAGGCWGPDGRGTLPVGPYVRVATLASLQSLAGLMTKQAMPLKVCGHGPLTTSWQLLNHGPAQLHSQGDAHLLEKLVGINFTYNSRCY